MVRFSFVVTLTLTFACAPEAEPNVEQPKAPEQKPPPEPDSKVEPEPVKEESVTEEHITITAAEATAAGLPALGFSLRTTGAGMSGSKFGDGQYVHLSGPPGGPLSLSISPTTIGADLQKLIGGATVATEQVELLGASRSAAAWVTGESLARTSWCALIVGRPEAKAGDPALLLELGVGHQGDAVTCKTALEDPTLKPIVESLTLD
jgi:hypothetical protein